MIKLLVLVMSNQCGGGKISDKHFFKNYLSSNSYARFTAREKRMPYNTSMNTYQRFRLDTEEYLIQDTMNHRCTIENVRTIELKFTIHSTLEILK